jgi:adenosylcobinamide-GDP ribazoletransferase
MPENDTSFLAPTDVFAAIGLMTRLPVRVDPDRAQARGARAAWAYPIAGGVAAALAGGAGLVLHWADVPDTISAGLTLAILIILTGALHEDGLADTADGLWGGWTVERRLDIMKDSRIGSYGVLALIVSVLLRWAALVSLINSALFLPAMMAAAMLSRSGMIAVMSGLSNARKGGLSANTGRPSKQTTGLGIGLAGAMTLLVCGFGGTVLLVGVTALTTLGAAAIAQAKIKGQTGDILGATQQLNEIALLATCAGLALQ